jgi:nucleotide-binding universal stress UspA family protein
MNAEPDAADEPDEPDAAQPDASDEADAAGEPTESTSPPSDADEVLTPRGASDLVGGRVVVGVDESEQAAVALRWALAEGALRNATVEVVHAWSPPMSALPFGATLVVPVDEAAVDAEVRRELEQMVGAAVAEMDERAPDVLITVLPGAPALTLVEVSEDADLLVVGSHGRTGLSRLVVGSVAMACVQHAHCPVVVIRTRHD